MALASYPDKIKALNASEERFRALVAASSDVIYRMNPDWSIMQELEGGSFLSDTGAPITDWLSKYIHPLDQEMVMQAIGAAIQNKAIFQLEHRVLKADGTVVWTSSRAVPILDKEGNIAEWFGAANDITSRRRIEEALEIAKNASEQQKALYEIITSNTPDLIYVFALDYTFIYANPALLGMWGKTWDEAIGKDLRANGYEPWHAEMHEREIDHIIATKEQVRGVVSFPHAALGKRIYDYILTPVIDLQGNVQAIAGTTRDITDIKEAEQRKNAFISMVSHELKTPLTSTINYVQVTKKRAEQHSDTIAADMLERASRQLAKMTRMINGFLNVSRLESGNLQVDRQSFDLAELVREVQEEIAVAIISHPIDFMPMEETWINGDREKISHVFNNLLENAAKYSPAGSPVKVFYAIDAGTITVSVSDEGMGINENELSLLFERYYRVKEAEARHISGFGIGLYLCAEIIKRHGGEIWATSEIGKGSSFSFTLPLHDD